MSDEAIHIATFTEVHEWQLDCSCGLSARVKSSDKEHARRWFHVHAEYADHERDHSTRGSGRVVVAQNGRPVE